MTDEAQGKNQGFISSIFDKAEKDRRETQRQSLVTAFNLIGSGFSSLFMNPKFLWKDAFMSVILFGSFHATKMGIALASHTFMNRFNKQQLVRETSKIHATNYLTLTFVWGHK